MQTRDEISATVRQLIVDKQRTVARRPSPHAFTEEAEFTDDLGFDSLDHVELVMAVEDKFGIEVSDDDAENLKTFGHAVDYLAKKLGVGADDDVETCFACQIAFKEGDRVLNDASGGALHASCCGPERESYTNGAGEPLGADDPIPEGYVWKPWPKRAVAA